MLKLFGLRMGSVTTPAKRQVRLEAQLARSSKLLRERTGTDPVTTRLVSAPGVGPITALTFKSAIEDPGRFKTSADADA